MRNLIIIALAFITLQATAQQRKEGEQRELRKERTAMTPSEKAELQTKKLTLRLDLKEEQQVKVNAILLEEARLRSAKMEEQRAKRAKHMEEMKIKREDQRTERLRSANERLDRQIALKAKMKEILDEDQYAKWEETLRSQKMRGQGHSKKRKNKQ